jgi:hypothetical protein
MPFYAYVDDSGSDPSSPTYVLGGLVHLADAWEGFSVDWKHVLDSPPPIEYFKGSEVWDQKKGPFAGLTIPERTTKVERLAHISILNFTYKPLDARFRLCLYRFERNEDSLEVETQWVRARTSHFSNRSTVR